MPLASNCVNLKRFPMQTNHVGARPILIAYIDVNIKTLRDVNMLKGQRQYSADNTAEAAPAAAPAHAAAAAPRGGRPGNAAPATPTAPATPSLPRSSPATPVPGPTRPDAAQPAPVRLAPDGLKTRWLKALHDR